MVLNEQFHNALYAENKPVSNYLNIYYQGKLAKWISAKLDVDYAGGSGFSGHTVKNYRQDSLETLQTADKNNYELYAAKLTFTSSLWTGELNYGYELSQTTNNQQFNVLSKGESAYLNSTQNTSRQLLNALFFTFSKQAGKFSVNAAIRYENVDFKYFKNEKKEEEPSKYYSNFFPSATIAYEHDGIHMQLSYRNSTWRPGYYQLRSELQYDNPYMYEAGNPYLKPARINTLSCLLVWKYLQSELSYNLYRDRIIFPLALLSEDVILFQPVNLDKSQNFSFSAVCSPTIGIWKPGLEFEFIKDFIKYGDLQINYNKPVITLALKNNIKLFNNLNLTANLSYQSKGHYGITYIYDTFRTDILLSKQFFDNKLRINLSANDIFGTNKQKSVTATNGGWSYLWKDNNTRNINISINYSFNATDSKYKGKQASNELNRL